MTPIIVAAGVVTILAGLAVRALRCRRAQRLSARMRRTRAEAEAIAAQRAAGMALEARARLAVSAWRRCGARPRQEHPPMRLVPGGTA